MHTLHQSTGKRSSGRVFTTVGAAIEQVRQPSVPRQCIVVYCAVRAAIEQVRQPSVPRQCIVVYCAVGAAIEQVRQPSMPRQCIVIYCECRDVMSELLISQFSVNTGDFADTCESASCCVQWQWDKSAWSSYSACWHPATRSVSTALFGKLVY